MRLTNYAGRLAIYCAVLDLIAVGVYFWKCYPLNH